MKAFSWSGTVPHHPWLAGAIALLVLTACATTPSAEEAQPPTVGTVDIAYGGVNDDHLFRSTITVHSEDVQPGQAKTLAEMLARLSGVRVIELHGGGLSVPIRGTTSFLGGEEPLFPLDGMVIQSGDGELRGIDPNTIESITCTLDTRPSVSLHSREPE